MKTLLWIVVSILVLMGLFIALDGDAYNNDGEQGNPMQETPQVIPISHATAVLRWGDTVFYTDPTGGAEAFAGQPPANIVLVTDVHGDHLSTSTLAAVVGPETTLIVPQSVKEKLPEDLAARATALKNGETFAVREFNVLAMPMYNLPESTDAFHTKGRGNGYIIGRDDVHVYVAGDTAGIPEMRALTNIDIALVPMNLPYTMSV